MTLVVLHLLRHKSFASESLGLNTTFCKVADYLKVVYHKVVPVMGIQGLLRREIDTLAGLAVFDWRRRGIGLLYIRL
jgi:hypothetical protein